MRDSSRPPSPDPAAALADALRRLDLARADVSRALDLLQRRPASAPSQDLPVAIARPASPSPERPSSRPFAVGDFVWIRNPRPHQHPHGIVIGVTPSNYVQVRTPDGSVILRIARNLRRGPPP